MPPAASITPLKRAAATPSSSPSKRVKQSSARTTSPGRASPRSPADMYNFTSSKQRTVIDLTDSPDGPTRRRPSMVIRPSVVSIKPGAKQIVIKNKKVPRYDPEAYEQDVWTKVDAALDVVFANGPRTFSMEELYKGIEHVTKQSRGAIFYKKLFTKCETHIRSVMKPQLLSVASTQLARVTLGKVVDAWSMWNTQMQVIRAMFYYMDRAFLLKSPTLPVIQELAIGLFRTHLINDPTIQSAIISGACRLLDSDRPRESTNDVPFNKDLFLITIEMFSVVTIYIRLYEPAMLASSQAFFTRWVQQQVVKTLPEYVKACGELIEAELERCRVFALAETTREGLILQMNQLFIIDQEATLTGPAAGDAIQTLFRENRVDDLHKLFTLLERVGLGKNLTQSFGAYIEEEGTTIVFDEAREAEMVIRLLQFKAKLDSILETAFEKHGDLGMTLKKSFEIFMNKQKKNNSNRGADNDKPGEMIAKHLDVLLRGGIKTVMNALTASSESKAVANDDEANDDDPSDGQLSVQLDKALDLFRFVRGKAVFEAFYKKDLAKRLLLNRSASSDAEQKMLARLTVECGAGFTHNLEQMFQDMELAKEEGNSYKTMLNDTGVQQKVDLSVSVLSIAAWPTYPDVVVEVPQDIQAATKRFEEYYKLKHTGRRLTWKHALAHCQLKARFPNGDKEIVVSGFQAIVLLYFNGRDGEDISYSEVKEATKLEHAELKRTLQSLACVPQFRVLSKSPKGKDVNETDTFRVDLNFSHKKIRIKVNQIQMRETKEEVEATHERVAIDRQYETQAAIVRIMKSKKTVKNAILMAEVIESLKHRGAVDAKQIKEQIEKLIDKDYMERDENDKGTFHYVA